MSLVQLALLIAALVCFVLSAANVPVRWNLIASGLALMTAALIVARWPA